MRAFSTFLLAVYAAAALTAHGATFRAISRMRQAMDDPANTDPSDKVVGPTMICYPAAAGIGVTTRVCTPPQFSAMWWENGGSLANCR